MIKELIVFDLEYTDPAVSKPFPEILEIGAVRVRNLEGNLEVIKKFNILLKPTHLEWITEFTTELTGITQEDIKVQFLSFDQAWKEFAKFTDWRRLPLMAWGVMDFLVLRNSYQSAKMGESGVAYPHNQMGVDAYSYLLGTGSKVPVKFRTACKKRGIEIEGEHRALKDALALVQLLKSYEEEEVEFKLYEV